MKTLECQEALGMESGAITNGMITASSRYDLSTASYRGRLNAPRVTFSSYGGSWSPASPKTDQWLQVDLGLNHGNRVTGIATQGRNSNNVNQWVIPYKLQLSDDEVIFQYYREQGQANDKVKWNLKF